MRLTAFACESVVVADQRLYALGAGLHALSTAAFPLALPALGVGMIAYLSDAEIRVRHPFEIGLQDAVGQPCSWQSAHAANASEGGLVLSNANPMTGEFAFTKDFIAVPGADQTIVAAFNFRDVVLKEAGAYSIYAQIGNLAGEVIPLQAILSSSGR